MKNLRQMIFPLLFIFFLCVNSYPQPFLIDEQQALWQKFLDNYKGTTAQKKVAYETAKELITKQGPLDCTDMFPFIKKWVGKYEASPNNFTENNKINKSEGSGLNETSADAFYRFALDSFSMHSMYLVLDVETDDYKGKAVVENISLFGTLNKTMGFNQKQYQEFMLDFLKKRERLRLTAIDFYKGGFYKLKPIATVESNIEEGKENFMKYYFPEGRFLQRCISREERYAVIAQLFEWRIPAMTHHYSGYLIVIPLREKEN